MGKNAIIALVVLVVFSLLLISVISVFASSVKPYYVKSTDPILKAKFDVRHEFPNAFSTDLTDAQVNSLRKRRIDIEEVSIFEIVTHNPKHPSGGGSSTSRKCFPSDQTPWGIERVYNNPSINSTSGGLGINVAVLDTGVFKDHLDLKARIADCKDFTGKGIKNSCGDGNGHGTHVSGTVLADAGTDKKGIYGVSPEAKLFAYKVCNNGGLCFGDSIAKAIRTASDNGAHIISMSLGGSSLSSVEKDAIDYTVNKGLLVVAAAGNSGPDLNTIKYPAAYLKVVAVAATDSTDTVPDFSSRGINDGDFIIEEREVEVATPGVSVESTYKDGCYVKASGTSMATPHVSGLAAKFWASGVADSNLDGVTTASDVRSYLQSRAKVTDITKGQHATTGDDPASGFGLPTVG